MSDRHHRSATDRDGRIGTVLRQGQGRSAHRGRLPAVAAVLVVLASGACAEAQSPDELEEEPTREPVTDATDFDVAPSP